MDITLVINPGSASKKYALFRGDTQILSILFEHVGEGYGTCVAIDTTRQTCDATTAKNFESSLEEALAIAVREGVIQSVDDIKRVGVRIVAPGTFFQTHRIIDDVFLRNLKKMEDAAPLHIPHTIAELNYVQKLLPNAQCVGVSDSVFHRTIPEYARRYSIPRADREDFDVYRFGYHGLSVRSVLRTATQKFGIATARVIVCHVGSGVSVTAVREGMSIDTTMGFSPTSGLMMSSRAGEIDPGVMLYLMKKKHLSVVEAEEYVTKRGGFMGILGQSDLRIALDRSNRGESEATIAIEMFVYHIRKAIGAYIAALGGLDVLILTGTVSERNAYVRAHICGGLDGLGIALDEKLNEERGGREGVLSQAQSPTKILVVRTDEMGEIARMVSTVI